LLVREANLQLKIENLKRSLEAAYDFTVQGCFKSVDDWNYGYIDKANLKRFLRQMGYVSSKMEVVSIIRRFDTDGDAKVNLNEF
jgi:Ca2+-binding EF-hand superfamily protein